MICVIDTNTQTDVYTNSHIQSVEYTRSFLTSVQITNNLNSYSNLIFRLIVICVWYFDIFCTAFRLIHFPTSVICQITHTDEHARAHSKDDDTISNNLWKNAYLRSLLKWLLCSYRQRISILSFLQNLSNQIISNA